MKFAVPSVSRTRRPFRVALIFVAATGLVMFWANTNQGHFRVAPVVTTSQTPTVTGAHNAMVAPALSGSSDNFFSRNREALAVLPQAHTQVLETHDTPPTQELVTLPSGRRVIKLTYTDGGIGYLPNISAYDPTTGQVKPASFPQPTETPSKESNDAT